ncbi:MAG: hypothetical protein IH997_08730 [Proteobacteria bacterium]|nr:hypothetical protein [Pseudomonadota bacterium]
MTIDLEMSTLEGGGNSPVKSTARFFDGTHSGVSKQEKYFDQGYQLVMVSANNRMGIRARS